MADGGAAADGGATGDGGLCLDIHGSYKVDASQCTALISLHNQSVTLVQLVKNKTVCDISIYMIYYLYGQVTPAGAITLTDNTFSCTGSAVGQALQLDCGAGCALTLNRI